MSGPFLLLHPVYIYIYVYKYVYPKYSDMQDSTMYNYAIGMCTD